MTAMAVLTQRGTRDDGGRIRCRLDTAVIYLKQGSNQPLTSKSVRNVARVGTNTVGII